MSVLSCVIVCVSVRACMCEYVRVCCRFFMCVCVTVRVYVCACVWLRLCLSLFFLFTSTQASMAASQAYYSKLTDEEVVSGVCIPELCVYNRQHTIAS